VCFRLFFNLFEFLRLEILWHFFLEFLQAFPYSLFGVPSGFSVLSFWSSFRLFRTFVFAEQVIEDRVFAVYHDAIGVFGSGGFSVFVEVDEFDSDRFLYLLLPQRGNYFLQSRKKIEEKLQIKNSIIIPSSSPSPQFLHLFQEAGVVNTVAAVDHGFGGIDFYKNEDNSTKANATKTVINCRYSVYDTRLLEEVKKLRGRRR
jgi:hypothetical protein